MSEASAVKAAEVAATETANEIQAANERADNAIERAAEQVEEAQEQAAAIARAAMETELGRRVEAICGELEECRGEIQALETELAEAKAEIQALEMTQTLPQKVIVEAPIIPEPENSLAPATLEAPPPLVAVEANPQEVTGASNAAVVVRPVPAEVVQRKRKML